MNYASYHWWIPPRHSTLKEMAEEVPKRRVKQINEHLIQYDDIDTE
jgi:hypothetical protein